MERCAVCGNFASKKCSGCNSKFYCSSEHQRSDWALNHRNNCKSYKISTNEILGRFMVAKRDIKAGEMILREKRCVLGPKTFSHVICLGCHKTISPPEFGDYYKCSKCSWPLCGKSCETLSFHDDECQLMSEKNFKSPLRYTGTYKIETSYCVITPLRVVLLKKSNPKAYESFLKLESHLKERNKTKLYAALKVNLVPFIRDFLKLNELSEDEILQIAGILDTNCFDVVLPSNQIRARGVYLEASMLAHECTPNTKHFVDKNMDLKVIACIDIKKGDTITTSYSYPLKTTIERRHQIREAKCFDCICSRCKDPTEMGTFASCIRCKQCVGGILVPVDPLKNSSEWNCTTCDCRIAADHVISSVLQARSSLDTLNRKSVKDCEDYLSKFNAILPSKSVFMTDVKFALAMLYGNIPELMIEDLTRHQVETKRDLCQEMIQTLGKFEPGLSNSVINARIEYSVAKIAQIKHQMIDEDICKDKALGVVETEARVIKELFGLLESGSEGKLLLEDRLKRVMKLIESSLKICDSLA